jgi:hypothetical protein
MHEGPLLHLRKCPTALLPCRNNANANQINQNSISMQSMSDRQQSRLRRACVGTFESGGEDKIAFPSL